MHVVILYKRDLLERGEMGRSRKTRGCGYGCGYYKRGLLERGDGWEQRGVAMGVVTTSTHGYFCPVDTSYEQETG